MTISVAIVAMDEEANIGRTLSSIAWADEIVLVDSGSKDRTCEIARADGALVVVEPWRGYVAQKQYAIDGANQLVTKRVRATGPRGAHRLPRSALLMPSSSDGLNRLSRTFSSRSA